MYNLFRTGWNANVWQNAIFTFRGFSHGVSWIRHLSKVPVAGQQMFFDLLLIAVKNCTWQAGGDRGLKHSHIPRCSIRLRHHLSPEQSIIPALIYSGWFTDVLGIFWPARLSSWWGSWQGRVNSQTWWVVESSWSPANVDVMPLKWTFPSRYASLRFSHCPFIFNVGNSRKQKCSLLLCHFPICLHFMLYEYSLACKCVLQSQNDSGYCLFVRTKNKNKNVLS